MFPGRGADAQGSPTAVGAGLSPSGVRERDPASTGKWAGPGVPRQTKPPAGRAPKVQREGRALPPTALEMQGLGSNVTLPARAVVVGRASTAGGDGSRAVRDGVQNEPMV